jgi:hypothetical protein
LKPKDAKAQAEKYIALGYFELVSDRYKVTAAAESRFGLSEQQSDAPEEVAETEMMERMAAE